MSIVNTLVEAAERTSALWKGEFCLVLANQQWLGAPFLEDVKAHDVLQTACHSLVVKVAKLDGKIQTGMMARVLLVCSLKLPSVA